MRLNRSSYALVSLVLVAAGVGPAGCRHDPSAPSEATPASKPEQTEPALVPTSRPAAASEAARPPLASVTDGWWRTAVFYEIFVRSFKDADGDGVGDFAGLTAQLDYLNDGDPETSSDLGVDALWLMPIKKSPSYHGYDVTDYQAVNPDYGTIEDFDRLLAAAHARGIKVIIDFVLNHSSSKHPWFKQSRSPDSKYRDYYVWRDRPDDRWKRPWDGAPVWHKTRSGYFYGLFWSGMPDLNLAHPEVEAHMVDAMRFWLDRGVDGFRVDAVRYLHQTDDGQIADVPATHAFVKKLRRRLADYPNAVWIGEAWTDMTKVAKYYGDGGDEFQLAFSFDIASAIIEAVNDGNRASLNQALATADTVMADRGFEAPFLTNHDMPRVMRSLGGDPGAMRVAAATMMAMPGTPFIYYGEEIGMQGGPLPRDEDKRTPMRWTDSQPGFGFTTAAKTWHPGTEASGVSVTAQRGREGSLWTLYRDLIALRHDHLALADGETATPVVKDGGRGVVAILRRSGDQRALFVANLHTEPAPAFTIDVEARPQVLMQEGLEGSPAARDGGLRFDGLGPRGFVYLTL